MTTNSDEKRRSDEVQRSFSGSTKFTTPATRGIPHLCFWIAVILSQVVGLVCIGLVVRWCQMFGGFAWDSDANKQFYYHPLLMILGLVFFYGDAMIVYRVLSFLPKFILKIIHGCLHLAAIVSSSVALVAVLENHRRTKKADFYSLHSWIGITTFAFFCLQYLGSFITFMLPWMPTVWRARIMPFHTFFGVGLFIMAVATAEMGITEKLVWTDNYSSGIPEGQMGNSLGLCLVVFAFLIVFITTHSAYKRQPLPEELPPQPLN
ncbi:hypothetical protein CDAR_245171 [Caerostris darwini]|uniref:Cytochrome b561 domain-containing protein n=1 Tax=Caerostris darwini TaxID=1538125 RepID=A0AAV4NZ90_9ARAC|nr:hypothetical protein CDAR_245171 [Caerostris darwini]